MKKSFGIVIAVLAVIVALTTCFREMPEGGDFYDTRTAASHS